jgi:Tol biopolymer transport system component
VVDPDGTDRQLVRGNGVGDVAWAPDGTRIAYVQYDYDQESWTLNVINHDGSGRTRVPTTSDVARLSWSPDGSQLVYQAGYDELYLTRLDGSAPTVLGTGRNPAWSPDGTSITYFDACDVRQTTLDGQNVRLVDLKSVSARCDYGGDLEWSPDGTELAAMVFQDEAARKGWTAVYLVSPDGSARSFTGWVDGWPWDGLTWRPTTTARRTA